MAGNVIFIPSKGRPQCVTGQYLTNIGYPGEWFIVVGDDDDSVWDYVETWGEERVLTFNKGVAYSETDMMDAYGDTRPTGVAPARNEITKIARAMGLERCWLMDDDYESIWSYEVDGFKKVDSGRRLFELMDQIEEFGISTGIPVVGFKEGPSGRKPYDYGMRVYCAHSMDLGDGLSKFSGRMLDDAVHAARQLRIGRSDFLFQHMFVKHCDKPFAYNDDAGGQGGGMSDAYESDYEEVVERQAYVRCRYIGYCLMQSPLGVTGTFDGWKVRPKDNDKDMAVKVMSERWSLNR